MHPKVRLEWRKIRSAWLPAGRNRRRLPLPGPRATWQRQGHLRTRTFVIVSVAHRVRKSLERNPSGCTHLAGLSPVSVSNFPLYPDFPRASFAPFPSGSSTSPLMTRSLQFDVRHPHIMSRVFPHPAYCRYKTPKFLPDCHELRPFRFSVQSRDPESGLRRSTPQDFPPGRPASYKWASSPDNSARKPSPCANLLTVFRVSSVC